MAKLLLKMTPQYVINCAIEGCVDGGMGNEGGPGGEGSVHGGPGSEAGGVTTDGELSNILWAIINEQNYQNHQFRNCAFQRPHPPRLR